MSKKQHLIIGLLLGLAVGSITLAIVLGFMFSTQRFPTQASVIVKETVLVEVTPTLTPIPQGKDRIVFLSVWEYDYYIVDSDGSNLARITNDGGEKSCPSWKPDGEHISFFMPSANKDYYDVYVMDVDGKNRRVLFQAKLDREYGQMPQWNPDGTKLAFSAYNDSDQYSHIYIYDGSGVKRLTDSTARERFPVWSPDGSKIAYISYHMEKPLLVVASADGIQSWLVSELPASNFSPATWSPDGRFLAFVSGRDLYISEFNNIGNLDRRTEFIHGEVFEPNWSPDGSVIAYFYQEASMSSSDVFAMPANRPIDVEWLTHQVWAYQESPISWSPDGKHAAIVGDTDTDNWNIYVINATGSGEVRITESDRRDHCPAWSP
jgi:TolB protein